MRNGLIILLIFLTFSQSVLGLKIAERKKSIESVITFIEQEEKLNKYSSDSLKYTFLAMLKPGLIEKEAIINDQVVFVVKQGQQILYNEYAHTAYIADGRNGYIPIDDLIRIDTSYFKFNFSKTNFNLSDKNILVRLSKEEGVDINALTQGVINKNSDSLLKLFELRYSFDASTEVYYTHFWSLLNLWSDDELSDFISNLSFEDKKSFCSYITNYHVTFPIENPMEYYRIFYPKTFRILNDMK